MELIGVQWERWRGWIVGKRASLWRDYSIHSFTHSFSIYSHFKSLLPGSFSKPVFSVNKSMFSYNVKGLYEGLPVLTCSWPGPRRPVQSHGQFHMLHTTHGDYSTGACISYVYLSWQFSGNESIDLVLTKFNELWHLATNRNKIHWGRCTFSH